MAAEESVLQLVNHAALLQVIKYLENPKKENRAWLLSVPAFFKALERPDANEEEIMEILTWVEERARSQLLSLLVEEPIAIIPEDMRPSDDDWIKVCRDCNSNYERRNLLNINEYLDGLFLLYANRSTSTYIPALDSRPEEREVGREAWGSLWQILLAVRRAWAHWWSDGCMVQPQRVLRLPLHTSKRREG